MYMLRTDRPTDDRSRILENFERSHLCNRSSNSLHVWSEDGVFGIGGSNGPNPDWTKSMTPTGRHLRKFRIAIISATVHPIHFVFVAGAKV